MSTITITNASTTGRRDERCGTSACAQGRGAVERPARAAHDVRRATRGALVGQCLEAFLQVMHRRSPGALLPAPPATASTRATRGPAPPSPSIRGSPAASRYGPTLDDDEEQHGALVGRQPAKVVEIRRVRRRVRTRRALIRASARPRLPSERRWFDASRTIVVRRYAAGSSSSARGRMASVRASASWTRSSASDLGGPDDGGEPPERGIERGEEGVVRLPLGPADARSLPAHISKTPLPTTP